MLKRYENPCIVVVKSVLAVLAVFFLFITATAGTIEGEPSPQASSVLLGEEIDIIDFCNVGIPGHWITTRNNPEIFWRSTGFEQVDMAIRSGVIVNITDARVVNGRLPIRIGGRDLWIIASGVRYVAGC